MADFSIEKTIDGPVIGLDEVGRGPLAGPVVSCGCHYLHYDDLESEIPITDSKKHTSKPVSYTHLTLPTIYSV